MKRTSTVTWRLPPELRSALEAQARAKRLSLSAVLEEATTSWLRSLQQEEAAKQEELHLAAEAFVGRLQGGDPDRSTQASALIRRKLQRHHAR